MIYFSDGSANQEINKGANAAKIFAYSLSTITNIAAAAFCILATIPLICSGNFLFAAVTIAGALVTLSTAAYSIARIVQLSKEIHRANKLN